MILFFSAAIKKVKMHNAHLNLEWGVWLCISPIFFHYQPCTHLLCKITSHLFLYLQKSYKSWENIFFHTWSFTKATATATVNWTEDNNSNNDTSHLFSDLYKFEKACFTRSLSHRHSHSTLCNDHIISSYACIYIIMHISLSRLCPFLATVVVFKKNETVFFKSWTWTVLCYYALLYWISLKNETRLQKISIFTVTSPLSNKTLMVMMFVIWMHVCVFCIVCMCPVP